MKCRPTSRSSAPLIRRDRLQDSDLDLSTARSTDVCTHPSAKGHLYGSHFLAHGAIATQPSGKTFLAELGDVGSMSSASCPESTRHLARASIGVAQILPGFGFRIPACERLLEGLGNYCTIRATASGLAVDGPAHDRAWSLWGFRPRVDRRRSRWG